MFITVSSCFVCVYLCMRVRAHTHSMECDLFIWVRTNLRRGEEWLGRVLIIPPTPDAPRHSASEWHCPSSVLSRGVCFGLNERRKECRLNGSDVESKVTGMARSILGTAENFPQILAFCVTYAKSLLCFQSHTTSLPNCVYFFFPIKVGGPLPPSGYAAYKKKSKYIHIHQ